MLGRSMPLAVLLVFVLALPAAADTTLSPVLCGGEVTGDVCSGVSAYGPLLVWDTSDLATREHRLWAITEPGAVPSPLPIAPRRTAFVADAGPGPDGHPVITYARCAGDPDGPTKGCGFYRFDPRTGNETRLLSAVTPPGTSVAVSEWRDRVAFTGPRAADRLRHPRLCSLTTGRCRTLPAGPAGGRPSAPSTGILRLDLGARALAFSWYSNPGPDPMMRQTRIAVIRDLEHPGRAATVVAKAGAGGAGNAAVFSPALDGDALYYARGGASCGYAGPPFRYGRYDLRTGRTRELSGRSVHGIAPWDGTIVVERCVGPQTTSAGPPLAIERLEPDPFAAAPPALVARACPARRTHGAGWSAPVTATHLGASATLAASPDGRLALVSGTSSGALLVRFRARGARAFGPPANLGPGEPFVAAARFDAAGRLLVVWGAAVGPKRSVRAAVADRAGHFGAVRTLGTQNPLLVRLAVNHDGLAVAAWAATTGVFVATSPAGGSFGAVQQLWASKAPVSLTGGLGLGLDDHGTALLAWGRRGGDPLAQGHVSDAVLTSTLGADGRFTEPAALPGVSGTPAAVAFGLDSDGAGALAWTEADAAGTRVMAARRSPDGAIGPPIRLSERGRIVSTADVPAVAAVGGRVLVAWGERDTNAARIATATITPAGVTTHPLTAFSGTAEWLHAALDARGNAAVAWQASCGASGRRIVAATARGGAPLGAPTAVSGPDRRPSLSAEDPLVLDAAGHPTLAWDLLPDPRSSDPMATRFARMP